MTSKKSYTAADIDTLEILEAIRTRPGMYISSVDDDGVEVCCREVIDNAVDEHMNGNGDKIVVSVDPDTGVVGVEDAARGIPVENHPKHPGLSTLEVVLTKAHSGGKFGDKYGISGGLHGTGLKAVTALSSHLKATVWRDGKEYTLVFQDARVVQKLDARKIADGRGARTGTMIEFRLDPARFPDATATVPSRERLQRLLRERAYLNPGLRLTLRWKGQRDETFHEKNGIDAYVSEIAGDKKVFPKVAHFENPADSEIRVAVAIAWTSGYSRDGVVGFCNCVRQPEGGTHVQGLRMALPGAVRAYIDANSLIPAKDKDLKVEGQDCFEGVHAIVSIRHRSPVFKGQAKTVLANSDAQGAVQRAVNAGLAQWLEENPKEARAIGLRAVAAAKARVAASKAREHVRKQDAGAFGMKNFGKLKDCSSKDPEGNELFIVEGESAGGSGAMARDRVTQAIYALKGKPLNSWECDQARIFSNAELSDLTCAIGTGLFAPEMPPEEVEAAMAKLRYGKVIIMADADIDGSHIECLLMGHLYKHALPLIERGHVYIALPPLYRITERGKHTFVKDDAALAAFFRRRAKAAVGDDASLAALAGVTARVREAIEDAAGQIGVTPTDLAHALRAVATYDDKRDDWLRAFAERIVELRGAECEGVEANEAGPDGQAVVVSGLEANGRYFTTVIDEALYQGVVATWNALSEDSVLGQEALADLVTGVPRTIEGEACWDLHAMAAAIDRSSRKGVVVQRNKGLGEMQAEELGETTLDRATRRLIRVSVADFGAAGDFIGSMMSASTVEARRQIVRSTHVDRDAIDA